MASGTVLVTGSAGSVGSALVPRLAARGWDVRAIDVVGSESTVGQQLVGDCFDDSVLDAVLPGCKAIAHLAAIAGEAPLSDIAPSHITGFGRLLEAARRHGVRQVAFASSNHAVGFIPSDGRIAGVEVAARPDGFYGVGKAAGEALCSLYADRYGFRTVSIRIGSFRDSPNTVRHLATWLSPDDLGAVFDAALLAPGQGHSIVYGISRNKRGWWDLEPGRAIGYEPADDAEDYIDVIDPQSGTPDELDYLGGSFAWTDHG
jgi:uronate dehydrogenase